MCRNRPCVASVTFDQLVTGLELLCVEPEFVDGTSQLEFASIVTAVQALRSYRNWGNEVAHEVTVEV